MTPLRAARSNAVRRGASVGCSSVVRHLCSSLSGGARYAATRSHSPIERGRTLPNTFQRCTQAHKCHCRSHQQHATKCVVGSLMADQQPTCVAATLDPTADAAAVPAYISWAACVGHRCIGFTPFHNSMCRFGFIHLDSSGTFKISKLSSAPSAHSPLTSLQYDARWPRRKLLQRATVHKVVYVADARCFVIAVSTKKPLSEMADISGVPLERNSIGKIIVWHRSRWWSSVAGCQPSIMAEMAVGSGRIPHSSTHRREVGAASH